MTSKKSSHYTSEPLSESVHACLGADLPSGRVEDHACQMMGCEIVFSPKRNNQRFCSKECRHAYFALARRAGAALIEKISQNNARSGDNQPLTLRVAWVDGELRFAPEEADATAVASRGGATGHIITVAELRDLESVPALDARNTAYGE